VPLPDLEGKLVLEVEDADGKRLSTLGCGRVDVSDGRRVDERIFSPAGVSRAVACDQERGFMSCRDVGMIILLTSSPSSTSTSPTTSPIIFRTHPSTPSVGAYTVCLSSIFPFPASPA